MKGIAIGEKTVGRGRPVFVVAEAGINHDGQLELARNLVIQAAHAGADAIKFQTFKADEFCGKGSEYYMLFKSLELKQDQWEQIAELAQSLGIVFLSTAFDKESADFLETLGVPAFKVSSGDLTHVPLLKYLARKGKPMILSTGMAWLAEIDESLNAIYSAGNRDVVLLHCVSNYPAKPDDVNLKAIATLEQVFKLPVGFSDHTMGWLIPLVAVSLGANLIEKHFTLDKELPGPDHKLSLTPSEFEEMVKGIRIVERSLGDGVKAPSQSELKERKALRRSIAARENIPKGTIITERMLKIIRPGTGIDPRFIDIVLGRIAAADIEADEILSWDKI